MWSINIRITLIAFAFLPLLVLAKNPDRTVSLNGDWQFGKARNYTGVARVPGIAADPAKIGTEKLWYKKRVQLPGGDWKYATLQLKGARFLPEVFINGEAVSKQNGGMAPTFHPLKHKAVKPGAAVDIEIALASLNDITPEDASFIPPADQWRSNVSSGLWDDVILHVHGSKRIDRIIPFIDYKNQKASIRFDLVNMPGGNTPGKVKLEVLDQKGKVLIAKSGTASLNDSISFHYGNILKSWSPDAPHLYRLRLSISDKSGLSDQQTISFGIKQFEVKGKQFYLNNEPSKIRGGTVVWHRWVRSAEGRELGFDTTWFKKNIVQRLKDHGANYLRFHLGKPPERFLDLCDQYGLLVQYEWSFFHGMPATKESLLEQYKNWLDVAMRHPSVALIHPYNETEGEQLDTAWDALGILLKSYPPLVLEDRDVIHVHKYWWSLFENLGLYYDDADQFPKAIMVDEFGGNYLDEKGELGGYKALKESYLRFLGRENTVSERLNFHAAAHAEVSEYWRRIDAAGFAPFCILSSWEDGNTWFMGDLKNGNPKPVWGDLTAAFSPVSVSVELWDRNFGPGQKIDLPVYLFNDSGQPYTYAVKLSIENKSGQVIWQQDVKAKADKYSKKVEKIPVVLPANQGSYTIKAELLNKPSTVKYPVVSKWEIQVFKAMVPDALARIRVAVPENEPELKAFLKGYQIASEPLKEGIKTDLIITSSHTWDRLSKGDEKLKNILQHAIEKGVSILMLDAGPKHLGQGYPSKSGELGPLQGVVRINDPEISIHQLFNGVSLKFTEAAEPESHLHPDKNNDALWVNLSKDHTRLWNGMRGGLIVPATDMEFSGLSSKAFLSQWKARGANESQIIKGPYYAYELQGFYEFSSKPNDEAVQKKLKAKVEFLVEDAPALASAINPRTPVSMTDLALGYLESQKGIAESFTPLANCGKNLTRTPVAMINFGAGKGKLIVSQLLTAGRMGKEFGEAGLYGIRYDEAAVQTVLNMMKLALQEKIK